MKKLKVFLSISPVADCGVGYYRMWLPLKEAEKRGLVELRIKHFTWGEQGAEQKKQLPPPNENDTYEDMLWSDVTYAARNDVPGYLALLGGVQEYIFQKHKKIVPILLDIDDNIHATRPHNPGYRSYHPNSQHNVWNIKSLGIFNGITVSTKNLKEFYSQHTEKGKLHVCPNSIDFNERDNLKPSNKYPKKPGEIRIGWSGSASHWENLKHIEKPVLEILKKYPETTFYMTGLFGDIFQSPELKNRVKYVGWSKLKYWAQMNIDMNLDIALAPLMDNDFNRAKSNLRVLEYSSAKYPVIASPVEPYKCFKKDEVLFAMEKDEWFKQIEKLILDVKLRKTLSNNLYKRAKKDFNISKNYKIWLDTFKKYV